MHAEIKIEIGIHARVYGSLDLESLGLKLYKACVVETIGYA